MKSCVTESLDEQNERILKGGSFVEYGVIYVKVIMPLGFES